MKFLLLLLCGFLSSCAFYLPQGAPMAPCGQMVRSAFHEVPPVMIGGIPPVPAVDRFGLGGYASGGGYNYGGYGGYGNGYGCSGGGYGFQQGGGFMIHKRVTITRTYSCNHPSCAPGRNSVMRH